MTPQAQHVGLRIRELRRAKAITQVDLAGLAGVPQSTISAYERGAIESPGFREIRRIARALDVSAPELLGEEVVEGDVVTIPGWSRLPEGVQAAIRTIVGATSGSGVQTSGEYRVPARAAELSDEEWDIVRRFREERLDALNKRAAEESPYGSRTVGRRPAPRGGQPRKAAARR